ncbi:MAG: zinc ribbon domain-containing protein, partial [Blastopirellula sp. JB062]
MSSAETLSTEEQLVEPLADELVDSHVAPPSGQPCPACGCPVEPQDKFCPACGTPSRQVEPAAPQKPADDLHKYFQCNGCGAKVNVSLDERAFVCPFCDSNYVVEYSPEAVGRQRPEFVIGFRITP